MQIVVFPQIFYFKSLKTYFMFKWLQKSYFPGNEISLYFFQSSIYSLHEKPYFPSPGISWKAQKDQVNIIFPSTFWFKKYPISHLQKVQSENFSVISNYHFSINFLAQKRPHFPSPDSSKQDLFSYQ